MQRPKLLGEEILAARGPQLPAVMLKVDYCGLFWRGLSFETILT